MNAALADLSHRIVAALCNGGYQGLLITGGVAVTLRLWRQANAATRYAVEFATLLVVAALPVLHFAFAPPALPPAPPSTTIDPAADASESVEPTDDATTSALSTFGLETEPVPMIALATELFATDPANTTAPAVVEPVDAPLSVPLPPTEPQIESGSSTPLWRAALPGVVSGLLVALWALLIVVRLGRLALQLAQLRRMKRQSLPATGSVAGLFAAIRDETPGTRAAALRVSPAVSSPVALGYWRPAVLVSPTLLAETEVEWEGILRHELAHVRRRDDWTNLLQQLVKSAYFFHPAVWWLDRRLTVDREIACDDHVLAAMRSPGDYALLLADLAGRMRGPVWSAAPAAWNHPSQLKERIHMILDTHRNASPRVVPAGAGLVGTFALLAALLALHAAPRLAVAEDAPPPADVAAPVTAIPAVPATPPEPPEPRNPP